METYRKAMQSEEWRTPKGSRHQRTYQLRCQKPNKTKQTDIKNTYTEKLHPEAKASQKKKKTKTEKSRAAARAAKQEWRSHRAWDDHIALLKEENELRLEAEAQERRELRQQVEQAWNDHFKWLDDYLAKMTTVEEDEEILITTNTSTHKRKYSEVF